VFPQPGNPQIIYDVQIGPNIGAPGDRGLYRSADGGVTFTSVHAGLPDYTNSQQGNFVAIDPSQPNILYFPINFSSGGLAQLWRSTDSGASWQQMPQPFGTNGIASIVVDPSNSSHLLLSTNSGVLNSYDGGNTWTQASTGNANAAFEVVYDSQTLFAATNGGIFRSIDDGATWTSLGFPGGDQIYSLAIDPQDPNIVFAGSANNNDVFISLDGGTSWSSLGQVPGFAEDYVTLAFDSQNTTLFAKSFGGPVYEMQLDLVKQDNWVNTSGGSWSTASNWKLGVPTASVEADIDATGTYSVAITKSVIAYGLLLNDAQATVTDNAGPLTLAGSGGTANPNGALTINAGTFVLNGGALNAGSISIGSGGVLQIAKGTYTLAETITDNGSLIDNTTATITGNITGTGTILAENKANLTITGNVGSENFTLANNAHVVIANAVSGTGSFTIANSAVLDFGGADSEPVTFASGSSGTVKFDQTLTQQVTTFAGTISGLTPKTKIDLADLNYVAGANASYSGGILTVTSGNQQVLLPLSGNFTNATWVVSKDATGGTLVVDPPAPTSTNNGPPGLDHVVALFTQSAAGFSDLNQHGALNTNPLSQVVTNQEQFLANPHHG
jgi:hypothetical protein